jgi:uncharacterized protein (DUF1697 family)
MTWIALLRGINITGRHIVPMKELRTLLEDFGCSNVRTYIQSGNVVFDNPRKLTDEIGAAIEDEFGFKPDVLVLTTKQFAAAIEKNPYRVDIGNSVHFFFCLTKPTTVDYDLLESVRADSESYQLIDKVFYLHAPDGVGRSKLVDKMGKAFKGVSMTARNLNTVRKIAEMAQIG